MVKLASAVVNQAKAWIGCNESDGSHEKIIDVYNSHKPLARGYVVKYTDAWCATFVSAVAIKCGYTSIIPTECGCQNQIALFKNLGEWVENDAYVPKAGDVIYYDWHDSGLGDNTGYADHVGIVEFCDGKDIVVIEGNKSNAVGRRTLAVNGRCIRGYGVPKYDAEDKSPSTKVTASKPAYRFNKNLAGSYKTTAKLNMRDGAGTSHKILTTLAKDLTVKNYGYYTDVNSVKWLYVQVTVGGVQYTGFCSSSYLQKV